MNDVYRGTFSLYRDLPVEKRNGIWRTWVKAFAMFGTLTTVLGCITYWLS